MTIPGGTDELPSMAWGAQQPESVAATILVVEDDALTRLCAVIAVEEAGYLSIVSENADEALVALGRYPQIGALFTDVRMPGSMNGLALAAETRRLWPRIGILVASGDANPRADELPAGAVFLRKPYSATQVESALLALLTPAESELLTLGGMA